MPNLFNAAPSNFLPFDGEVYYYPNVLSKTQSEAYFTQLLNTIQWQHDEVIMFGKRIVTQRKMAWYAINNLSYTYANSTKNALNFTALLVELKIMAQKICNTTFNACLLNLYPNGQQSMGWHSDNEKSIVANSPIASFSLGAERKFLFKHKVSKQNVSVFLQNGSLMVMQNQTQQHWWHSLPKTTKVNQPRINLTFRQMAY
jgi:alkylated DNA repair dioxygenase AlkB